MARPRLLTENEKQSLRPRLSKMEKLVADSTGAVEAAWAWYDRRQGIVEWAFRNADSIQRSTILMRSSYYLGDGYWPIYSYNPAFRTVLLDGRETIRPLEERSVPLNTAPLGLVQFGNLQHAVICLIVTLSPGQAWGMLEGGFGQTGPASTIAIYGVTPTNGGDFCLGYDPAEVKDWNEQTKMRLSAYTPNPSTFNTWLFQAETTARYSKQFSGDSIASGRCTEATPQVQGQAIGPKGQETSDMFPPVFPDVLLPPLNP